MRAASLSPRSDPRPALRHTALSPAGTASAPVSSDTSSDSTEVGEARPPVDPPPVPGLLPASDTPPPVAVEPAAGLACLAMPDARTLACGERWKVQRRLVIGSAVLLLMLGGAYGIVTNPDVRRDTFLSEVKRWAMQCGQGDALAEAEAVARAYYDRLAQAGLLSMSLGDCPPAGAAVEATLEDRFSSALFDASLANAAALPAGAPVLITLGLWALLLQAGLFG